MDAHLIGELQIKTCTPTQVSFMKINITVLISSHKMLF